ncbi:DUF1376 domain-containing protein [Alicyclobacillus fastidiosus]|uniref:DUF1376 domain-containing protein n=1 Tax=Alicyclobacillus fastidiosus TaxID=392011 RepID=UPI0023E9F95A|nr:DUF1376 domain-containing protein [Alicyclobacillus fastidiosus]GMA59707.1 hypothetical protein GCM10025859_01470 [Alicyclobacillus fastidiosus]
MDAPYFPFYPADWLSDPNVQFLSLEEAGAYITLLAYMWRDGKDCALPDDDKYVARLLHVSTRKWAKLREILLDGEHAVLTKTSDGLIRNKRLDKEFTKMVDRSEKRTAAAIMRWQKEKSKDAKAVQLHPVSNANASDLHLQNDAISDSDPYSDPNKDLERDRIRAQQELVQAYEQICGPMRRDEKNIRLLLEYLDEGVHADLVIHALKNRATQIIQRNTQTALCAGT